MRPNRSAVAARKRTRARPLYQLSKRVREALERESDRALGQQIRGRLALPMHKRVWFLRVWLPDGSGSHL